MKNSKFFCSLIFVLAIAGCAGSDSSSGSGEGTAQVNEKIVNGVVQPEAASPQIVELVLNFADGTQGICTGTVIGKDSVLTAGHCIDSLPQSIAVKVNGQFIFAKQAIIHPGYFPDPVVTAIFNDAAVIKVDGLNAPIMPIGISQPVVVGGPLMVIGYGLDENKQLGTLKAGISSVQTVTPSHIFGPPFDGSNVNPCNGDSGGPAVQDFTTPEGFKYSAIVGIVSTGTVSGCADGDMTLYTNVQDPNIYLFIAQNAPDAVFY